MSIILDGDGTISGLSVGGLNDGIITGAELDGAQSGSAPIYGARAWVNFNGTGTVAIRASGNVTSITDNGTGDYNINFTTAMPDANYSAQVTAQIASGNYLQVFMYGDSGAVLQNPSSSSFRFFLGNYNSAAAADSAIVMASIFR
jgi:hypothetical protein